MKTFIAQICVFVLFGICSLLYLSFGNGYGQDKPVEPVLGETYYSTILAKQLNGVPEFRLFDQSRVDILTRDLALEVDWAGKSLKWSEAIGQTLYYARVTNRKPGVILLTTSTTPSLAEQRNIHRCLVACSAINIPVWIANVQDIEKENFDLFTTLRNLP